MDCPLAAIKLGVGFEQIERRADFRGARGSPRRLVMAAPQPSPEPAAANGPGLTMAIDQEIHKAGPGRRVKELGRHASTGGEHISQQH